MKTDYLNMASKFYEVDLKAARDNNQKKFYDVLKSATNIKPKNVKIDEKPDLEDLLIDENDISVFDMEDMNDENKILIFDLLEKTDFSEVGNIKYNDQE